MKYQLDDNPSALEEFISSITDSIRRELEYNDEGVVEYTKQGKKKKKLNENEIRVGYALIDILENWESLFDNNLDGSTKYNKNQFYATVRENTNLNTKDIRNAMKRYKDLYLLIKEDKIDEGLI
ncbi:MAG: hypothetical protein GTO02_17805 [Candidatus Dadabacteria bacterium]|nr:hypothetical protein [Candidatus Dadabacteria bacterium]